MSAEDDASMPEPEKLQSESASVATGGEPQTMAAEPQKHEEETVIDVA